MYQPNVNLAVGPSFIENGVAYCGTRTAVIAGCVPWNPAAPMGYTGPGSLSNQEVQDYLFARYVDKSQTTTKVASANISGSLFSLPAGDVMAAMGFEHRSEEARYTPDLMVQNGQIAGTSGKPTQGDYSLNEVYLEMQVPLLADMAFARELSLDVAGRYSDYNNFGSTTNSKFGVKWKPIDSLLVRATYGTGFRAPTVDDLYGGTVSSRDSFTDPCDTSFGTAATSAAVAARCKALKVPANFRQLNSDGSVASKPGQQATTDFNSGSNPNLKPETAKTGPWAWSTAPTSCRARTSARTGGRSASTTPSLASRPPTSWNSATCRARTPPAAASPVAATARSTRWTVRWSTPATAKPPAMTSARATACRKPRSASSPLPEHHLYRLSGAAQRQRRDHAGGTADQLGWQLPCALYPQPDWQYGNRASAGLHATTPA